MEPWRKGWSLYSSPADGGNNVEHTHHDRKQEMQFAFRPLASGIKMTILLPVPPATKLKLAIPPKSGHLGPTTFFACNHNGVGPTTRSRQTHACRSDFVSDAFGFPSGFVFRTQALRMSFASNSFSSRINRLSFTNRPSAPFGYASGTSKSFPRTNTYGRGSSLVGGLEEEVDCGVCGGALTLPFSDFPSWGTSLELEAGKAGNSPTVGSEEEAAMLPLGSERGSSSSKRRGEVDGGRDSGLEAGAGGDSPGFQQVSSSSHPFSGMVTGTRTERSALMMHSASLMNPFGKGVTTTSSRLPLWLATSSQRCSD